MRVERGRRLVFRIDHQSRNSERGTRLEYPLASIRQQDGSQTLPVQIQADRQSPQKRDRHRIPRKFPGKRIGQSIASDTPGAQCVKASEPSRLPVQRSRKYTCEIAPYVLAGVALDVKIELGLAAAK